MTEPPKIPAEELDELRELFGGLASPIVRTPEMEAYLAYVERERAPAMTDPSSDADATPAAKPPRAWHPRLEMRYRVHPYTTTEAPILEQLWQCHLTGKLWWRRVPRVVGWEDDEP